MGCRKARLEPAFPLRCGSCMMMARMPDGLSVVIPTSGKAVFLESVLQALRNQGRPVAEVIVVDNNAVPRVPRQPAATVIHEPRAGLSAARNAGLAAARNEYVAYLDDDAVPEAAWAEHLLEGMRRYGALAAGGTVELATAEAFPAWLPPESRALLAELLYDGADIPDLDESRYLVGANFCVRKNVLERFGGFRADFGRVENLLRSSEELELCRRIQKAGGRVSFIAAARVFHQVRAGRLTRRYLLSRAYWQGRSDAQLDLLHGKPAGDGSGANVLREFRALLSPEPSRRFLQFQKAARRLGYGIEVLEAAWHRQSNCAAACRGSETKAPPGAV